VRKNPGTLLCSAQNRSKLNRLSLLAAPFASMLLAFPGWQSRALAGVLPLHVDGNHLADPSGHPVTLRGVASVDVNTMPNTPFGTAGLIDRMVDGGAGFDSTVVRLVVFPGEQGSIKPAVDECVAKNIYCIIDFHYFGDGNGQYKTPQADSDVRNFWNTVAPQYKDVPNVLYEMFNEPYAPNDWATWKQTAQPWVDLIRAAAPNTIIMIGSPQWSSYTKYAATDPFKGSNLAYTIHLYPSTFGAGQSQGWPPPNDFNSAWEDGFGAAANKVPVFLTEGGWNATDGTGQQKGWYGKTSDFGTKLRNYLDNVHPNIDWSLWNYSPNWGPAMLDYSWNPLGGDDAGQFVQQWLRDKKNSNQSSSSGSVGSTPQSLYVKAGGSSFTGKDNTNWVADEYFDGGNTADRGNIAVQGDSAGKSDWTERYGMNSYHIPLANGTYKVTLDFAETYGAINGAGQRVFDANVGGTTISNIDPFGDTGGQNIEDRKQVTVNVTNGKLDITFTPHVQQPEINGIEISPQ